MGWLITVLHILFSHILQHFPGLAWTLEAPWWSWCTLSPKTSQQRRSRRRWRTWRASAATSPPTPPMVRRASGTCTWSCRTWRCAAGRATCTSSASPRMTCPPSCRWAATSTSPASTPPSAPREGGRTSSSLISARWVCVWRLFVWFFYRLDSRDGQGGEKIHMYL